MHDNRKQGVLMIGICESLCWAAFLQGLKGAFLCQKYSFTFTSQPDSETERVLDDANRMIDWQAGKDAQWIQDNLEIFQTRADNGDQDYVDLLEELKGRPDLHA